MLSRSPTWLLTHSLSSLSSSLAGLGPPTLSGVVRRVVSAAAQPITPTHPQAEQRPGPHASPPNARWWWWWLREKEERTGRCAGDDEKRGGRAAHEDDEGSGHGFPKTITAVTTAATTRGRG